MKTTNNSSKMNSRSPELSLVNTICPICETYDDYSVIFPSNFSATHFNATVFSARRLPDKVHYQIVKCNKCGLVRSNPTLQSSLLDDLYKKSKLTYNEEISNLTKTYMNSVSPILKKISQKGKILEIGCGNGFMLSALRRNSYHHVWGVEPSKDAVQQAPTEIRKRILVKPFSKKLFKAGSFDLIMVFQTFDHIPDPTNFLSSCQTLLKRGGYLLLFNHDVNSFSSKILGEKSPIFDIEHTYLYSKTTIEMILKKNRFEVKSTYFPHNIVSLKHLFWLLPIPKHIKLKIINSKAKMLESHLSISLGNLCAISRKI